MSTQNFGYNTSRNPYLIQQVNTASPEKIISLLYDLGIKSCRAKDRQKASKVLVELISALNFDYGEIPLMYFNLYRFALDNVHKDNFEDALMIFEGLSDIWQSAILNSQEMKN
ncbi:MAG: flagellar export chaperone FliS [bacterium]